MPDNYTSVFTVSEEFGIDEMALGPDQYIENNRLMQKGEPVPTFGGFWFHTLPEAWAYANGWRAAKLNRYYRKKRELEEQIAEYDKKIRQLDQLLVIKRIENP